MATTIDNPLLNINYNGDGQYTVEGLDKDGDGVIDGQALNSADSRVISESDLNILLAKYGLRAEAGNLVAVDGYVVSTDSAAVVTDPGAFQIPTVEDYGADPERLNSQLSWLNDTPEAETSALMWMTLSTMARSSMRDMTDAKEIKFAMQKGKLEAKQAQIESEQNRIEAERDEANTAFAVSIGSAIMQAAGAYFAPTNGTLGAVLSAGGKVVEAGYDAYSKNSGSQAEANKEKIRGMYAEKMQDVMQSAVDEAQSSYEEAKEQFKLALKILTDHADRESDIERRISKG